MNNLKHLNRKKKLKKEEKGMRRKTDLVEDEWNVLENDGAQWSKKRIQCAFESDYNRDNKYKNNNVQSTYSLGTQDSARRDR